MALEKTAARFALGITRKGKKSWNALSENQEILTNKEFLIERCSHIIHHALKLRDKLHKGDIVGLAEDDDASAVVWGGMCVMRSALSWMVGKKFCYIRLTLPQKKTN